MGFFDNAKDKVEDVADDVDDKFHEEKGKMEERHDQAKAEDEDELDDDDDYEPEEKAI